MTFIVFLKWIFHYEHGICTVMEKKFNSISINQLIHFVFSTLSSAYLTWSVLCFHLTRWKNTFFGNTAEQVIEDNPELEAIIDYCAKRAAPFIPIFPLFISARFSVCALLISIFISLSWPQKYVKGQWNTNWSLGQARQMMKQDTLILQWPVNFEWVKNSCTLDIVYKHNNAERSLAVH